jgi:hypothetical protein
MPDTVVRLGHQAKIRINGGNVFAVTGGEMRFLVQTHDTTDSEAEMDDDFNSFEDAEPGLQRGEVTLEFQHEKNVNVHSAPLNIRPGKTIELYVYADGIDGDPYRFPSFLLGQGSRGLALRSPQAGRIQGQSKGRFYFPPE